MSAIATAMPTAAETKFWTARPAICAEVRQRRLARVELPVRVRQERRRRVERDVPGARAEVPRVERVQRLGAQDHVEQQRRRAPLKTSTRPRVGLPVLPAPGVDAQQAVEHRSTGAETRREDDALAVKTRAM